MPVTGHCARCGAPFTCKPRELLVRLYCSQACYNAVRHLRETPLLDRAAAKSLPWDGVGCRVFAGAKDKRTGYGKISVGHQKWGLLHREVYKATYGPNSIPEGFVVHHTCGNRLCWNVEHLVLIVDQGEHIRISNVPNIVLSQNDVCRKGHPLVGDNVIEERSRKWIVRRCRTCRNEWARTRTGPEPVGEHHGRAKLRNEDVREIRLRGSTGTPGKDLAARFGVSTATITLILRRKTWTHLP